MRLFSGNWAMPEKEKLMKDFEAPRK